jgi:hypothetical protein
MTLETILEDAKKCPVISDDAAQAYAGHMNRMAEDVDFHLMSYPDLEKTDWQQSASCHAGQPQKSCRIHGDRFCVQ